MSKITLRDRIAIAAMAALIAKQPPISSGPTKFTDTPTGKQVSRNALQETYDATAIGAYNYADAMLALRGRK